MVDGKSHQLAEKRNDEKKKKKKTCQLSTLDAKFTPFIIEQTNNKHYLTVILYM